jgi:hypothetical protein
MAEYKPHVIDVTKPLQAIANGFGLWPVVVIFAAGVFGIVNRNNIVSVLGSVTGRAVGAVVQESKPAFKTACEGLTRGACYDNSPQLPSGR